jgi:DNA-binding HxlR family transcriptional regulator
LIQKNPGYGHPLRPEYILQPKSEKITNKCHVFYEKLVKYNLGNLLKSKWNIPVLFILKDKKFRFSELKRLFEGITSRSLALTIKNLEREQLIERILISDYPPTTLYSISHNFRFLIPILNELNSILK